MLATLSYVSQKAQTVPGQVRWLYVSNVSIIFDCSMLYYLLFWMFIGFIIHFYIIFGTNLLTQSPVLVSVFFLVLEYRKKGKSKRSPIDLKLHGTYFWKESNPRDLESTSRKLRGSREVGGRAHPPGRALHPRGPLVAPLTYFFRLYISIYPKNIGEHYRSGVPPPEASVATESQSRPIPAPCRRGQSLSGGHLHHPGALHDEEGVVLPRG